MTWLVDSDTATLLRAAAFEVSPDGVEWVRTAHRFTLTSPDLHYLDSTNDYCIMFHNGCA